MLTIDRRALLLSGAGLLLSATARAQPSPGERNGTFADSVGVNVHISSEPYNSKFELFKKLLAESGIRHLRDELRPSNNLDRWRALNSELGIKFNILVSPATNSITDMMAYLDALGIQRISAVEGQNEGDSDWFMSLPLAKPDWSKVVIDYQRDAYQALRARYSAAELPILSPSVIDWKPADAKLLRPAADFCDMVAIHSYVQRAQEPETEDNYASVDWYLRNMRDEFKPGAAVMVTEIGYCNVIRPTSSGVSEQTAAIYLPRMLLNNFRLGIRRTFIYEFMNGGIDPNEGEHNWGLVRNDGSPKPAFGAIKRLLAGLDGARPLTTPSPELGVSVPTPSADLRLVALQDPAGHLVLAIWRAVRSWDVRNAIDMQVDAKPVGIAIDGRIKSVSRNVPNDDDRWRDVPNAQGSVTVDVADKIVLLRFKA